MRPECAIKTEFLYINSRILRKKQEKREDWLALGEDGEVKVEDYFMPVAKATGLGKREKEENDDKKMKGDLSPSRVSVRAT